MLSCCPHMPLSFKGFQVKLSISTWAGLPQCLNHVSGHVVTLPLPVERWRRQHRGGSTGTLLPNPTCHIRRDHSKTERATRRTHALVPLKHVDTETDQTRFPNHAHHDRLLSSRKARLPFPPNCPQNKTLHPEAQTLTHQAGFFSNTRICTK